jgi:hypothetical protein
MPTSQYLLEQAARCRRLAAHMLDQDLQHRLLGLAEEYQRKAAAPPADLRRNGAGDRARPGRAPRTAEDLYRDAGELETEMVEP